MKKALHKSGIKPFQFYGTTFNQSIFDYERRNNTDAVIVLFNTNIFMGPAGIIEKSLKIKFLTVPIKNKLLFCSNTYRQAILSWLKKTLQ